MYDRVIIIRLHLRSLCHIVCQSCIDTCIRYSKLNKTSDCKTYLQRRSIGYSCLWSWILCNLPVSSTLPRSLSFLLIPHQYHCRDFITGALSQDGSYAATDTSVLTSHESMMNISHQLSMTQLTIPLLFCELTSHMHIYFRVWKRLNSLYINHFFYFTIHV